MKRISIKNNPSEQSIEETYTDEELGLILSYYRDIILLPN